ncbi:MAG: hypothetical protein A3D50_00970 [Candidatus Taylorbacteria bacterium RIFCSPHIGHO2_02_FULL_44_12]|uniref:Peptidase S11 D-alanyl-D-alanine carboxypeptidase A N-terminal domain-containing protein n=1 Tax=Candidatus Taylorbacteria bacterium RIFCSPHIGHO2_02_FULL_44_12 TaxID=1802308 RepID=A0A1G2MK18_9BACT|nr:MAG: hypothetical protein A3D50_00970 [Candidatus Taylorbacteria bacterium RIFCSPHIGHO2_02_FULL_44_12]
MHPSRNVILIACICLAMVGIAAGIKGARSQTINPPELSTKKQPITIPTAVEHSFFEDGSAEAALPPTNYPTINPDGIGAKAYIVGDLETDLIYLERNSGSVLPVASMSKLLTALVVLDNLSSTTTIQIGSDQSALPDISGIHPGEKFMVSELLYPLLISSSNRAAEALASFKDRPNFMELMRGYALEIGLPASYFADPSGISPDNRASARGILAFAKYLYISRPDILTITRIPFMAISTTSEHDAHDFISTHPFAKDERFVGGKTGRTVAAGETMMTILLLGDRPIAIIVLGSEIGGREGDTRLLLDRVKNILDK